MAWTEWRNGWATTRWRGADGSRHAAGAGTRDPEAAERHRRAIELAEEGHGREPARLEAGEVLEAFLRSMEGEVRPATIRHYRDALGGFCERMAGAPIHTWTVLDAERWLADGRARGWGRRTCQVFVVALRRLRSWAVPRGVPLGDVAGALRVPVAPPRTPVLVTRAQIDAMLDLVSDRSPGGDVDDRSHHRMSAFVALCGLAALRPVEACALAWSDVDLEAAALAVTRWKRRADPRQVVPMAPALVARLAALPRGVGPVVGEDWGGNARQRLVARLKSLARRAGVEGWRRFRAYDLRHSCATAWAEAGVPQHVIGELLGHVRGSHMAARYCSATMPALRAAVAR